VTQLTERRILLTLVSGLLLAGCGERSAGPPGDAPANPRDFLLPNDPGKAQSVIEARKQARTGDEVVLVGRVGGSKQPVTKGRLSFTLVDLSLKACDEDPNCYDFA
jgi:hypothetical protein